MTRRLLKRTERHLRDPARVFKRRSAIEPLQQLPLTERASIAYNRAMQPLSTKAVIGGIALVSAAALLTAFVAQFAFGLAPCELCMLQRVPYGAVLLFALLALTPAFDAPTRREVAWLCAGLFAIEAVIAAYHAGVEYHWWPGPTACTGRIKDFSIEDLTNALNRPAPPVQCDQPAFTFHGISMAGANAIAAATFTILTAIAIMRTNWSRP